MGIGTRGQALTEFALGLLIIVLTLGGIASLMAHLMDRTHCARLTFEQAHRVLTGGIPKPTLRVLVTQTKTHVHAKGFCAGGLERVSLKRLESL